MPPNILTHTIYFNQTITATTDLDRSVLLKGELRCSLLQSRHSRPQQRPTATDHVHRCRRFPTCSSSRSRLVWNADHGLWRVTTRNQLWENVFRPRFGADARSLGGVESARGRTRV